MSAAALRADQTAAHDQVIPSFRECVTHTYCTYSLFRHARSLFCAQWVSARGQQERRDAPICCSKMTSRTEIDYASDFLCNFNASAMDQERSRDSVRDLITLVLTDDQGPGQHATGGIMFFLRCVVFAKFRNIRFWNIGKAVPEPIARSILFVRNHGPKHWDEGPGLGRFPDAGVMMFADENGEFDRSCNRVSAFSLRQYWLDDPEGGDESGFDGESLRGNLFSRVSLPALRASSCFRYPACPSACSLPLVTPLAAPVYPCPRFASSSRAARLVQSLCSIDAILTRLGFSVRSKRVRGESCLFSEYA